MPSVEDYIHGPLDIIQSLLGGDSTEHEAKIKEYFSERLSTSTAMSWVPSLNHIPLHNLRTNTLVKFRCMIQDMYDPEFYLGIYESEDEKSGEKKLRSGKYKDIAECEPGWRIQMESDRNKTMDRQTLYCVPVPGENEWVKEGFKNLSQANVAPSTSFSSSRPKRPLDDDTDSSTKTAAGSADVDMETETDPGAATDGDSKKTKTEPKPSGSSSSTPDLNFPLPGEKGPAVLVKVYEGADQYKVNDVVEFVGILSNDPAMVQFENDEQSSSFLGADGDQMEVEEQNAHSPPPSLVPRLHVLLSHPLKHVNPILPTHLTATDTMSEVDSALQAARQSREHLISVLEQMLLGDKLAAEFLLCNLVSNIYARQDVIPLGKFAVNLSACPTDSAFATHFYKVMKELVTKSHLLQMSLSNMNTLRFCPKKDYTANRLMSGVLQLSERTHLVIDETALQPGQLDANGVQNITAIGNLLRWQKVEYDFNFHRQDFISNIPIIVLSEGKSLLTCDCRVPLSPQRPASDLSTMYEAVETFLTPALLSQLRAYLTLVRQLDYSITEDVQKTVEEDFVDMRKENPKNMTVEDFHSLLILARLLSLSYGEKTLTREVWEKARGMEQSRKLRLGNNPTAPTA